MSTLTSLGGCVSCRSGAAAAEIVVPAEPSDADAGAGALTATAVVNASASHRLRMSSPPELHEAARRLLVQDAVLCHSAPRERPAVVFCRIILISRHP